MFNYLRAPIVLILLVIGILGAGCAPAPTPTAAPTATALPPSPTAIPSTPTISAAITLPPANPWMTPGALPQSAYTPVPNTTAPNLVGTYAYSMKEGFEIPKRTLTLLADGTWSTTRGGAKGDNGVYRVTGNQISFIDYDDRSMTCPPSQEPGVYKWELDGATMTLTPVNDPCTVGGRVPFLSEKWTKEKSGF